MTQPGPQQATSGAHSGADSAVENVAALILQATQAAAQSILDASVKAAGEIAAAATSVQTALSTPPSNSIDAEQLVVAFETMQANQMNGGAPDDWNGYGLPIDPELDILVDQHGTRWNPNPGEEPVIPSTDRESFAIVPPGTPLVPQLPRFDN